MTIVEATRTVTGGIDTHSNFPSGRRLDEVGGLLGVNPLRPGPDDYAGVGGGTCHAALEEGTRS